MDGDIFRSGDIAEVNQVKLLVEIIGGGVKLTPLPAIVRRIRTEPKRGLDRRERFGLTRGEPGD